MTTRLPRPFSQFKTSMLNVLFSACDQVRRESCDRVRSRRAQACMRASSAFWPLPAPFAYSLLRAPRLHLLRKRPDSGVAFCAVPESARLFLALVGGADKAYASASSSSNAERLASRVDDSRKSLAALVDGAFAVTAIGGASKAATAKPQTRMLFLTRRCRICPSSISLYTVAVETFNLRATWTTVMTASSRSSDASPTTAP